MENKQLNEKQLQALLRLKRYEQPPPGYFGDLLSSIHERQREELLRRPAWRIAAERVKTFFQSFRVDWRYAGAMAGILLTGIGMIQIALPKQQPGLFASSKPNIIAEPVSLQAAPSAPMLTLDVKNQKLLPPLQRVSLRSRSGTQASLQFAGGGLPTSYEATQIRF